MKKYALLAVAAVMIVALVIAGCGKKEATGVAEINGKSISYEEFAKQMSQTPGAAQALTQMLEDKMILDLAENNKVPPTDKQINTWVDFLKKITPDLETELKEQGGSMDDLKDRFKIQWAKANLAEKVAKEKVSEEDIKIQYEQSKEAFQMPERMKVQFVEFLTKAAADKAAKEVTTLDALKKAGAEQTAEHSKVGSAVVPKTGRGVEPSLSKAAFDTPIGKVSKPIKRTGGMMRQESYIVMSPEKKIPALTISEKDAEPVIRFQLNLQKAASDPEFEKMIEKGRKDAKVTIKMPQLKQAEKDFKNPPPPSMGMPMMPPQAQPSR